MEHVLLHCLNHPFLYWFCKDIAVSESGQYNGARNIFFAGAKSNELPPDIGEPMVRTMPDGIRVVSECQCKTDLLRRCEDLTIPGDVTRGISAVLYPIGHKYHQA